MNSDGTDMTMHSLLKRANECKGDLLMPNRDPGESAARFFDALPVLVDPPERSVDETSSVCGRHCVAVHVRNLVDKLAHSRL